jgi:RHS repeat-associated protein
VWNDRDNGQGSELSDLIYVYDGWNLVAKQNANSGNARVRTYTWGLDLSGTPQGAGGVGGLLALTYYGSSTTNCFVAFDGNGNVAALVNVADSAAVAQYEYGPFGEVIRVTGPMGLVNPFRFSTKYQDGETDLLYYGYRYYGASTGRWLSRDPLEETDGPNVYLFAGNDPNDFWDLLGWRWKVSRKGGAKASAVPESGDTVADLANLIGLSSAEYQKWLTASSGTAMPGSSSQAMTGCEQFEVPNTVVAYWAGDLGWFGRWWVRWNSSVKYLRARGFNVDNQRHQKGSTLALTSNLATRSIDKELHGLYFWGHGSAPYPAQYLVSASGDAVLAFSSPGLYYHMALGLVFACDSNSGQNALMSGNGNQIWRGFNGTLVPWPFRAYHARHYIRPGQQETH